MRRSYADCALDTGIDMCTPSTAFSKLGPPKHTLLHTYCAPGRLKATASRVHGCGFPGQSNVQRKGRGLRNVGLDELRRKETVQVSFYWGLSRPLITSTHIQLCLLHRPLLNKKKISLFSPAEYISSTVAPSSPSSITGFSRPHR